MRVIILGAGISGLSAAHFLSKHVDTTILEKSQRAGGWMGSDSADGFFFERGPRTLRVAKTSPLWRLIQELGLEDRVIFGAKEARRRFLWKGGRLQRLPRWSGALLSAVIKDLRAKKVEEDETVWDFACRRFGSKIAAEIFDPLVTGIYAADARELSAKACLPRLKEWESRYGSVLRGFWKAPKSPSTGLFSFRGGTQELVDALQKRPIHFGAEVRRVHFFPDGVEVETTQGTFLGDAVFSALPYSEAARLFAPELDMAASSLTIVNLGYDHSVLPRKGFGYLVSSQEKETALGVVFNSCAFPQHNRHSEETRLSVMLRGESTAEEALLALRRHLGIAAQPKTVHVRAAKDIFPYMGVGYLDTIAQLEKTLAEKFPRLKLLGNYLGGVGVGDCVARAKVVVDTFLSAIPS